MALFILRRFILLIFDDVKRANSRALLLVMICFNEYLSTIN